MLTIMKIAVISIILMLLFVIPIYTQADSPQSLTIKSIRRVSKSQTNRNPGIEIELSTSDVDGFYVGAQFFCLQIGKLSGIKERENHINTLLLSITEDDWKRLKNGDPMFLSYGCRTVTNYEKAKPFAFLNKKLLKKLKGSK